MLVTKQIEIDMGHRVPNHKSKCSNIHGHRYVIEVGVDDKLISETGASDEGMVIDFGDLKELMMKHIDETYDHSFTYWVEDEMADVYQQMQEEYDQKMNVIPFIPTAENLAMVWYTTLEPYLFDRKIQINHVKVWETPTSTATFTGT